MRQIEVELRFQLLAVESFDLPGDDPALPDGFFGNLDQPPPLETIQIGALHIQQHQGTTGADILSLRAFGQLARLHQIARVAEVVDALIGDHAAGEGGLVFSK
jgi:hypothetical protein